MSDDMIPRDTGKLWGEVKTIKGVIESIRVWSEAKVNEMNLHLFGPNGQNGMNGNIKALVAETKVIHERIDRVQEDVHRGVEWGRRLWEVERHEPGKCLGVSAVRELEADIAKEREKRKRAEESEARERAKDRRQMRALMVTLIVAIITVFGPQVPGIIKTLVSGQPPVPQGEVMGIKP